MSLNRLGSWRFCRLDRRRAKLTSCPSIPPTSSSGGVVPPTDEDRGLGRGASDCSGKPLASSKGRGLADKFNDRLGIGRSMVSAGLSSLENVRAFFLRFTNSLKDDMADDRRFLVCEHECWCWLKWFCVVNIRLHTQV
jgi:hypothetical protein